MTPEQTTVVLLAAGRGARMRELTDTVPKPLLKVGEHALIEHHLHKLSAAGFAHVVINTAYLGEQLQRHLGNGANYNLKIEYSDESASGALETAGGLRHALPLIKSDPFLVINADIYTDFDFTELLRPLANTELDNQEFQGRLVVVENPEQNPEGDFSIAGSAQSTSLTRTFSGIALYSKSMFADLDEGKCALGPILKKMVVDNQLELIEHSGKWTDVGTPERLAQLDSELNSELKS